MATLITGRPRGYAHRWESHQRVQREFETLLDNVANTLQEEVG